MEHVADQLFSLDFADWSALRPCSGDTKLLRENKKATLSRIREVYVSLLARGGEVPAWPPEPQEKVEPGAAVGHGLPGPGVAEQHLPLTTLTTNPPSRAAPGLRAAPDGTLALFPSLAALDECLTPAVAQSAPGADGELRAKSDSNLRPRSRQAPEPSAALTAQGLKLAPPANSPAEFLRQHVSLQPAGLPGRQQKRWRKQQQHQQQQEAETDQPRQGRQWRAQSHIAKALSGKTGRRQGRGVSSSFAFSPFSQQEQAFGSLPLDGAAGGPLPGHRLSRMGTAGATSQAVDALKWGAGAGCGLEGAPGVALSHRVQQSDTAEAGSLSQPQPQRQQQERAPDALSHQELGKPAHDHHDAGDSSSQPEAFAHATIAQEQQQQQQQQQPHSNSLTHKPQLQPDRQSFGGSTEPSLQGPQASQGALFGDYTLPPPSNIPPPVPFGSSTEPDAASPTSQQGQQRQSGASPPPAAVSGSATAQPAGCSHAQHEQQQQQAEQVQQQQQAEQVQQQQQQQQVGQEDHLHVQESQHGSEGAAGGHATSPPPSLPPDSSPPFSWRLSPLPASMAAEIAAAGAGTPSFPLQGAGAAAGEPGSGPGWGAGARAVWDSVPPTPAAMLDFTQTAEEGPLSPPEACTDTPDSGGMQQQRSVQRCQPPPEPGWSPQLQVQRQRRGSAGASSPAEGRQSPGQPPGAAQAQRDCLLSRSWAADGAAEAARGVGRGTAGKRPLQPQAAENQPASDTAAAAGPMAPSPISLPASSAGSAHGLQLRMPTPALAAVATPDARYAAVLLGSYGQYEPTEVVVLRLEPASLQPPEPCPAATPATVAAQDWSRPSCQLGRLPGVEVVASVAIRPGSTRPAWPLNANSLQLGLDARGGPLLLLSAALEPDDLAANATRAVSVISFAAGIPKLEFEIETKEPWWSLLWLSKGTFLAAGQGGLVQACSLNLPLRQYVWSPPLPTAVYHGYELNDLAQLAVSPCEPKILVGVSSDGALALWDLARRSLVAVHSSYKYRIQQPQLVSWEHAAGGSKALSASLRGAPAGAAPAGEGGGRTNSGGPFTILAQLLPRSHSGSGSAAVLGAVVATGSRLTVGGTTVQVQGLTTSTVCGDLCLAGTEKGVLHVWDLQSGARAIIDALDGQRVTSICHVRLAARDADAGYPNGPARDAVAGAGICKAVPRHALHSGAAQKGELPVQDLALVTGAGGHCLLLSLAATPSNKQL